MSSITPKEMSREEKSLILYVETVAVEYGGLLEGIRMNGEDMKNLERFQSAELLRYGRIPGKLLGIFARKVSHWCDLTPAGWELAHALRRERAAKEDSARKRVNAVFAERENAHATLQGAGK